MVLSLLTHIDEGEIFKAKLLASIVIILLACLVACNGNRKPQAVIIVASDPDPTGISPDSLLTLRISEMNLRFHSRLK